MKYSVVILLFTSLELFGQRIIQLVSQEDRTPVPFVHISVDNSRVGFTSNENGFAEIDERVNQETLVFYAVGYHQRRIAFNSIDDTIALKPKTSVLDEIEVVAKKSEEYVLDEIKSHWLRLSQPELGNGGVSVITAKTFDFQKDPNDNIFVKSVALRIKSRIDQAKFQLHVFELNATNTPEHDLISVPIIVELDKGTGIVEIDLTEYALIFPDNGLAIGVEWLLIESNRIEINGETKYEPSFYFQESNGRTLHLLHGEWIEMPFSQNQKENLALSCQLNLTN